MGCVAGTPVRLRVELTGYNLKDEALQTFNVYLKNPDGADRSIASRAVKVAKEKHDLRFDIPCLGPQTLETCAAARITVLAFEAGKSLLLEQETCAQLARKHKIAVTTVG